MTTSPTPPGLQRSPSKGAAWTWFAGVGAVILISLMWRCSSGLVQGRKLADTAVNQFHERLNLGDYEEIYRHADEAFRGRSHDDAIRFLDSVHSKLGLAVTATQVNIRIDRNTHGTFLTTRYKTAYAADTAIEMFTWIENDKTLTLYGYHIQSDVLMREEKSPVITPKP